MKILLAMMLMAFGAWLLESRRRRRHPVPAGLQSHIDLPFEAPFELYHNALSLCSMKARLCLVELGIPYKSHPIDLIETGAYENIRAPFLRVNPGGTVPVLVHLGHPVYESHEQIRYAARVAPEGAPRLIPEDESLRQEMEHWIDRSSLTDDPLRQGDRSAGNAVPGLTLPLFATMLEKIPFWRLVEGLLFHFDKQRPFLFFVLKLRGIEGLVAMPPAARMIEKNRRQMEVHLDALEAQLEKAGGPWILGRLFSLADVSWAVIFERLRQTDALSGFADESVRPGCAAYWKHLTARPSYRAAIEQESHPLIEYGRQRIVDAKAASPTLESCLEGSS